MSSLSCGNVFWYPSGTTQHPSKLHLHIVCTDTDFEGNALLVSVATYKNKNCDSTCILNVGDHPKIKQESYIVYQKACIVVAAECLKFVTNGQRRFHDDLDDELLQKVRASIFNSLQTPRRIQIYLKNHS